jgi:cytochrome P450
MSDNIQVDRDELRALLERVLFTTRDEQVHDRARQFLWKYFTPSLDRGYQPIYSNLGEPPQDE